MKGKLVGTLAWLVIVTTDVDERMIVVVEVIEEAPASASSPVVVSDVSLSSSPSSSSPALAVEAEFVTADGVEAGGIEIKDPITEIVDLDVGATLVPLT